MTMLANWMGDASDPLPRVTPGRPVSIALAVCSIALSVYLIVHLFGLMGRGFDFTDEGYYLNWISRPWGYSPETSQFGFVYNSLYNLLNGDIVALRRLNLLLSVLLAFLVVFYALRSAGSVTFDWSDTLIKVAAAIAVATLSILLYRLWLPTPNYNSLALLSILVFAAGVVTTRSSGHARRATGWHIMSFGVFLAFTAKPTTAVLLAVLAAIYALSSRRFRVIELLSASLLFAALFAMFAWLFYGNPQQLVVGLLDGARSAAFLSNSYTVEGVLRFDPIGLSADEAWAFYGAVVVLTACGLAPATLMGQALVGVATLVLLGLSAAQMLSDAPFYAAQSEQLGLLILAVPAYALLLLVGQSFMRRQLSVLADIDWHTTVLFVFLPFAFVLGSGGNYWTGAVGAGLFWPLAGFMMFGGQQPASARLLPASVFAQLIAILVVAVAVNQPYRQPEPLAAQNTEFVYGAGRSLLLAPDVEGYLTALRATASQSGFKAGDYMLDLTGHYPGALFAIGARSLGRAWIIGGYPGSRDLAARILGTVPCEKLARAWVLLEQGGPRALPTDVLEVRGLEAGRDYDWSTPIRSLTPSEDSTFWHVLLRPRADNISICK